MDKKTLWVSTLGSGIALLGVTLTQKSNLSDWIFWPLIALAGLLMLAGVVTLITIWPFGRKTAESRADPPPPTRPDPGLNTASIDHSQISNSITVVGHGNYVAGQPQQTPSPAQQSDRLEVAVGSGTQSLAQSDWRSLMITNPTGRIAGKCYARITECRSVDTRRSVGPAYGSRLPWSSHESGYTYETDIAAEHTKALDVVIARSRSGRTDTFGVLGLHDIEDAHIIISELPIGSYEFDIDLITATPGFVPNQVAVTITFRGRRDLVITERYNRKLWIRDLVKGAAYPSLD